MRRAILATLLAAAAAHAQEPSPPPGIGGVISGSGFTKIKIAIPDPTADALSGEACLSAYRVVVANVNRAQHGLERQALDDQRAEHDRERRQDDEVAKVDRAGIQSRG